MHKKLNIIKGLLLAGMVTSALPAAAVSYHSTYYVSRYNIVGTSWRVLPPNANHFCYLSRVGVRETDTPGELAMCQVIRSGAAWILRADLGATADADVLCGAICYNN